MKVVSFLTFHNQREIVQRKLKDSQKLRINMKNKSHDFEK